MTLEVTCDHFYVMQKLGDLFKSFRSSDHITTTYFTDNFCPCYNPEGNGLLTMNLSILNILSYGDLNLFWDTKILRIREIMTLFK